MFLKRALKEVKDTLTDPDYNWPMRRRHLYQYVVRRALRQTRVTGIELQHTFKCNAKCSFCSMGDSLNIQRSLEPAMFDLILKESIKEGVLLFVFLGGETFLDRNIWDYLRRCWLAGIRTEIQTNGTLLNRDYLDRMKALHVKNVSVTWHSMDAEEHDSILHVPGAFKRLTEAMDYAESIGLKMGLKALYSKKTDREGTFESIMREAQRRNLLLNVNPYMPVGSAFDDGDRLDPEYVAKFKRIMTTENNLTSHVFSNKEAVGCFAGKDYFNINPDGELIPCYFMPLSVGNIKTMSLREAHRRVMTIPIFRNRYPLCYVAASENFYQKCLVPIHQNYEHLPVNIYDHPEVLDILKSFNWGNL